ncbi:hypothetical protein [Achromobacter phage Motura]|uniref:Uncharacterized protein n=1 Tax=Achromobacter phage Motura TaxID=2591403 RepID=A0A514CSQ8_9CAUD|nr:hypothetical protein H1O15_gp295 [Achromobacter phage Motura]QDH83511.1 hypothetical protein [Achromobacter phage Motura]
MKSFLVAVMLAMAPIVAHSIEYVNQGTWDATPRSERAICKPNKADGMIVLTSISHPQHPKFKTVFGTTPAGPVVTGYWSTIGDTTFSITWDGVNQVNLHEVNSFRLCRF